VRCLDIEFRPMDLHLAEWNSEDNSGNLAADGMYRRRDVFVEIQKNYKIQLTR